MIEIRNEREANWVLLNSCAPCSGDCRQGRECVSAYGPEDAEAGVLEVVRWVLVAVIALWAVVGFGLVRCAS